MTPEEEMRQEKPLVSVLVPVFNYENYLPDAIDSVLAQTYENIEILIQDNQSTDNSFAIALEYADKYPEKVRAMRNVKNSGGGSQNIVGMIGYAKGEYYFFFSADDVMEPTCIEQCMRAAQQFPSAGLFLVERQEIGSASENRDGYLPFYDRSFFIEGKKHLPVFTVTGITILSQTMVSRTAYRDSGGISMIYQIPTDWNLNIAVAMVSDMVYLRQPLIRYRVHEGNETATYVRNHLQIIHHYGMLLNFFDRAEAAELDEVLARKDEAIRKLGQMCLRYSVACSRGGHYQSARNYLNFALIFDETLGTDGLYKVLEQHLQPDREDMPGLEQALQTGDYLLRRTKSYQPPEGYIEIAEVASNG